MTLTLILAWLAVLPFQGRDKQETAKAILKASVAQGLSIEETRRWVALMAQESAFNPNAHNPRSNTAGIGQISPRYLDHFRAKVNDPLADPYTLEGGLKLSAYVFHRCSKIRKTAQKTFACYFAGSHNPCTVKWPHPKCPETNQHVKLVMRHYVKLD